MKDSLPSAKEAYEYWLYSVMCLSIREGFCYSSLLRRLLSLKSDLLSWLCFRIPLLSRRTLYSLIGSITP